MFWRISAVAALLALSVPAPGVAVTGPEQVSFGTVRVGNNAKTSIAFTVANGEQVAAALIEGGEPFEILDDGCVGTRPAERCFVDVRFAPSTAGPQPATLHVGDAAVRLNASAYGVGPSLEASRLELSWGGRDGPVDGVRRVRLINRGDESIRITRLAIAGRDAAFFSVASSQCTGRRLDADDRCKISVRLRSPGGSRRARLEIVTELPQVPYTIGLSHEATTGGGGGGGGGGGDGENDGGDGGPGPICPCATAPAANAAGWSFGVIRASFVGRVVTDIYTSDAARLTVTVFRGNTAVKSTSTSGRVSGAPRVVVRVALKRGGYRVRVVANRPRDSRTLWKSLTVR